MREITSEGLQLWGRTVKQVALSREAVQTARTHLMAHQRFPIVDLSGFESNKQQVSEQLAQAARDIGFFYIQGEHLVPC